ncbi:MAG: DUF5814 domain-containing protein [Halobacteriota archaeon]
MAHIIAHPQRANIKLFSVESHNPVDATLTLSDTPKGPRPKRLLMKQGGREHHRRPAEVVELFRRHDVTLVEREQSTAAEQKVLHDLIALFRAYQIPYEQVRVCGFCIGNKQYKPTNERNFVRYHGELICMECARVELHRELSFRGFLNDDYFYRLLDKARDLDRLMRLLDSGFDPELTRFDVLSRRVERHSGIELGELAVDERLKHTLKQQVTHLLPVQSIAVDRGLLEGRDLLVVSATATGKTLIGELAGIDNVLKSKGKLLFIVPLVALANQKYSEFTARYAGLGVTTSIRIGASRIKTRDWKRMQPNYAADVLVGTYEGIDQVLRMGTAGVLGEIGTIVIDEVHMLEDEERGSRLDGLISRLKTLAPRAQCIYLSATVGNPEALACELGAELVEYEQRPVPIERHLIVTHDRDKRNIINRLIRHELARTSSKGYKGQSIIFTNSRARCHTLSRSLAVRSAPYHGGLSYTERKKVETAFAQGAVDVVVTTAALGAGVDFPASQVIFESLAMGINWLTTQEFHQMLGRAGRPDYHDIGKVVLLADPDKRFRGGETEDSVAMRLLSSSIEDVDIEYDDDQQAEQALANITFGHKVTMLARYDSASSVRKLERLGCIAPNGNATELGYVVSSHFLTMAETSSMTESVQRGDNPVDIMLALETFTHVYLNNVQRYARALGVNLSPNVFSGGNLEMLFSGSGDELTRLDQKELDSILAFSVTFVTCRCESSPFCGCPERNFSRWLIDQRLEGLEPEAIVDHMVTFGVHAYAGDVINYLDQVVRIMESIEAIAKIFNRNDLARRAAFVKAHVEG